MSGHRVEALHIMVSRLRLYSDARQSVLVLLRRAALGLGASSIQGGWNEPEFVNLFTNWRGSHSVDWGRRGNLASSTICELDFGGVSAGTDEGAMILKIPSPTTPNGASMAALKGRSFWATMMTLIASA